MISNGRLVYQARECIVFTVIVDPELSNIPSNRCKYEGWYAVVNLYRRSSLQLVQVRSSGQLIYGQQPPGEARKTSWAVGGMVRCTEAL